MREKRRFWESIFAEASVERSRSLLEVETGFHGRAETWLMPSYFIVSGRVDLVVVVCWSVWILVAGVTLRCYGC